MALDPNRWTLKTQEAVQAAIERAKRENHAEVGPDHLLGALLAQPDGVVLPTLEKAGIPARTVATQVDERLARVPKAYGGAEPTLSREARDVLDAADRARAELRDDYLSTEHLLLAMADRVGLSREDLLKVLAEIRGSHRVTSQNPEETFRALERFGRDLTEAARAGKLDPV